MNKTKIEFCDYTWNPVSGCLHGCEYCYAKKFVHRFGQESSADGSCHDINQCRIRSYHEAAYHTGLYPYGFDPTLYRDRLSEPAKVKKPQTVFVCSMADLFGDWIPDSWIRQVFDACEAAPWHRYLFLTKNPERYNKIQEAGWLPDKHWYGYTAEAPDKLFHIGAKHAFVSIEPMQNGIGNELYLHALDWIIVGAETGNRKGKIIPKLDWIVDIARHCYASCTPLFMKNSLKDIWKEPLIQELPWKARKDG